MPAIDFSSKKYKRFQRWRKIVDRIATVIISCGGFSVIGAVMLILFFLFYQVIPLFSQASLSIESDIKVSQLNINQSSINKPLYLALEEYGEVALRLSKSGHIIFFNPKNAKIIKQTRLPIPADVSITSFSLHSEESHLLAVGLSNGQALVFKHEYEITYPDNKKIITPHITYPYGDSLLTISPDGLSLNTLAISKNEQILLLAGYSDLSLNILKIKQEENFFSDEVTITQEDFTYPITQIIKDHKLTTLLIDPTQTWLYALQNNQQLLIFDLPGSDEDLSGFAFSQTIQMTSSLSPSKSQMIPIDQDQSPQHLKFLLGGNSLLSTDIYGQIHQWNMINQMGNWKFTKIRSFRDQSSPIKLIAVEQRRKNFLTIDHQGLLSIYNTTGEKTLLQEQISNQPVVAMAVAPRGNAFILEDENQQLKYFNLVNEHPEISFKSLWSKVWYEGYSKPEFIWQSSASSNDFEPKFSLIPLAFGTLKATLYAMLFATPLALCGAMFTAFFMTPRLRKKIKPTIELLEALPTVIVGFLAGIWLAPFIEKYLCGVLSLLVMLPVAVLFFSYCWAHIPKQVIRFIPNGWEPISLIPILMLTTIITIWSSPLIEQAFFENNIFLWLNQKLGIPYDQRNALVVGIAMGFALIPTIFSIAEDALFAVPKHLINGSLALGATPWQTLTRVVIPTASPAIFSALMIGTGRAVGETMIVLMATGNTPVLDLQIFSGMRTLSANIAVEMPESEVGSSHYHILFLAALVLFLFTFIVNTMAEIIRQRLRKKFSNI